MPPICPVLIFILTSYANTFAILSTSGFDHVEGTLQVLNSTKRETELRPQRAVQNSVNRYNPVTIVERSLPQRHGDVTSEEEIGGKEVSSKVVSYPQWNNMFLYNHLLSRAFLRPLSYPSGKFAFSSSNARSNPFLFAKRDDILTDGIKVTPVSGFIGLDNINNSTTNEKAANGEFFTAPEMESTRPEVRKRPAGDVEYCMIDTVEMLMKFREYISTNEGQLLLTCSGHVTVNKCEGLCNSLVKPDVTAYDGFGRSCNCCKDAQRRSRAVALTLCDIASNEVFGYSLTRQIVEPTECACSECSRH